jgi:acetyl esterase/lipase
LDKYRKVVMGFLMAVRRWLVACACIVWLASACSAEPRQPANGATTIALWPTDFAIPRPEVTGPETVKVGNGPGIAGRSVTAISNVARPTMTVYRAKRRNTGTALLVFPGGGYEILAIDLEGTEVCDWATARGITCAVLKYRVPWTGPHWDEACKCQRVPAVPMALQDAQRAMAILRSRAPEFGIDPHKIGVVGFSAGGHLVQAVTNADALSYRPVDAVDRQDTRPDFGVALYPGHIWAGEGFQPEPFDHFSSKAPPTLIVAAEDDPVDDVRNSITYFLALRDAKVPAEMHLYAHGGHAFGMRPTPQPITHWPDLMEQWLHTIGILKE